MQPGVTCIRSNVLVHAITSDFGTFVIWHMLLVRKTCTTSAPFELLRWASICPWMYMTAIGAWLLQYLDAATGATPRKRVSPLQSICTTICAPELCPVPKTRRVSMQYVF